MNGRTAAVALVACLLVVGLLGPAGAGAQAQSQVDPNFEAYVPQPTLTPGQPNELAVQVVNDAEDAADTAKTAGSVEVSLSASGTPISVQSGRTLLGPMPDGQPAQPTFALDVPYDAPAGTYELTLSVTYTVDGERETTDVPVEVRVEERPVFEVSTAEASVDVGETGNVSVTVDNVGEETARDATVTLESTSSQVVFGESASASRFAGTVEPGESVTLEFDLSVAPGAARQSYALRVSVAYTDEAGQPGQSRTLSVGFVPGAEQEFGVEDVTGNLQVGEDGHLRGTLVNAGDERVRDVVLQVQSNSASVTLQEREVPLGNLDGGERTEFSIPVTVSEEAEAGAKRFALTVEYRTADGERGTNDVDDARVEVRPATDDFDVSAVEAAVDAGSGTTLRLEVTNEREEPVEDVTAKLFADSPLSVDDDEAYVGTLEPGESAVVSFSVSASGSALAKEYPVEVDFQYRTPDGDTRLSDTYSVPVSVRESDGGGLPSTPLLAVGALALLVVLAAVGVVAYRRL